MCPCGHRDAAVGADRLERAGIVEPEIPRVVVALGQCQPLFGKDLTEALEVQRLAVGDDAVEVEDDAAERHGLSFSPA